MHRQQDSLPILLLHRSSRNRLSYVANWLVYYPIPNAPGDGKFLVLQA